MQTPLDKELDELRQKLLTMASHAETSVKLAVEALITRDDSLALQVKANDDIIDRFEVEVDEQAIRLLAKAPLAGDLRAVTVAMKISQNLERVGDEASKIAKRARDLNGEAPLKTSIDLPAMAKITAEMLKGALDAFVQHDPVTARAIVERDLEVDAINKTARRELERLMMEKPDNVRRALHLMIAVKSLERIADHATNVAEEVVYLCEAQDIRHAKP